jgi:serine/threonine-protein kinase
MDKYIGKTLDKRYEILEILGVGGMAFVYKARCHLLNRFVAIKILKDEFARDADFRKRFHAESQAVAMLSHPNIMAVYDVSRSKELEYIVMELIDGITLKQYMRQKGLLNWREALHFAIQVIKALSHAHSRGIIHRDIKPHNIMILRDGSVKVADFGIARFASKQHTLTKEALGSVHYISPEQARGSHIDARSDIYSVGVVLYEMLTERLPFEGDSPVSVALQHINSLPLSPKEINKEIPDALEMIILKAMAPKLTKRYASADAMLKDMEEFRKNPSISFEYNASDLQTAADDEADGSSTRKLPGGAKGRGMKLDAKTEAEERKRIKQEMIEEENDKTRKSGNMIATLSAILGVFVLVAILGFVIVGMINNLLNPPDVTMVDVPHLRNTEFTSEDDLKEKYRDLRFVVEFVHSNTQKEGIIIDQEPLSRQAAVGSTIFLTVSLGREPVDEFIDLAGMHIQEAQAWLTQNGLLFDRADNTTETHETIPRDHVISSAPAFGSKVFKGDRVVLTVSLGPDVKKVTMPSLYGFTEADAIITLTGYNLRIGTRTVVPSEAPAGTVVGQSVQANDTVDENTIINIEISDGSEAAPPTPTPSETPVPSPTPGNGPNEDVIPVSFTQSIKIPAPQDLEGTRMLSVELNGNRIFDQPIGPYEENVDVPITGLPTDIVRVLLDGELLYERTIESLLQP